MEFTLIFSLSYLSWPMTFTFKYRTDCLKQKERMALSFIICRDHSDNKSTKANRQTIGILADGFGRIRLNYLGVAYCTVCWPVNPQALRTEQSHTLPCLWWFRVGKRSTHTHTRTQTYTDRWSRPPSQAHTFVKGGRTAHCCQNHQRLTVVTDRQLQPTIRQAVSQ